MDSFDADRASDVRIHQLIIGGDAALSATFTNFRGDSAFTQDAVTAGTEVLLALRNDVPVARVSLHTVADLVGAPGVSGLIGHYEAVDLEAGVRIIREASRLLMERGAARVLGPMNGSTWARYRFAVPREVTDPPADMGDWFAGEPCNPPSYPDHWEAAGAGMSIVSEYESRSEPLAAVSETPSGVHRIRPIDTTAFDKELETLHAVSLDAFDENYLYSPISFDVFAQMYAPFRTRLDPEFVLLAGDADGKVIGFIFSYADPLSLRDGRPTRLIVKTLAVAKAGRDRRVSSALLDRVRRLAYERGFVEVISALMRSDNVTRGMAERRSSRLFRRYRLYGLTR